MTERNKRSTSGLPLSVIAVLLLALTTGNVLAATRNVLAADDKACSQQERANKTLGEKLHQTAGIICPPDVDPSIKVPTPNAGKTPVIPPPGSPGGDQTVQPK